MKKIFIVSGAKGSGKTKTLKKIIEIMKSKNYKILFDDEREGKDEIIIFEINNFKIGIETRGDTGKLVARSMKFLKEKNCNIIACASRTYGNTIAEIVKMENYGYTIEEKYTKEDLKKGNLSEIILKKILNLIS